MHDVRAICAESGLERDAAQLRAIIERSDLEPVAIQELLRDLLAECDGDVGRRRDVVLIVRRLNVEHARRRGVEFHRRHFDGASRGVGDREAEDRCARRHIVRSDEAERNGRAPDRNGVEFIATVRIGARDEMQCTVREQAAGDRRQHLRSNGRSADAWLRFDESADGDRVAEVQRHCERKRMRCHDAAG